MCFSQDRILDLENLAGCKSTNRSVTYAQLLNWEVSPIAVDIVLSVLPALAFFGMLHQLVGMLYRLFGILLPCGLIN